jgi:DNA polymerase V
MDKQYYTGFPSASEEHRRPALNLHTLLAPRSLYTFFARHTGDAMTGANIFDDDLLVIERTSDYSDGHIVLAFVDGERLVRRFERREGRLFLCPANSRYAELELDEEAQVFGRIVHSITHHLRIKQQVTHSISSL